MESIASSEAVRHDGGAASLVPVDNPSARILNRNQRRTLDALCRRIAPDAYHSAASFDLATSVESRLAAGDPYVREQVATLLTAFDHPITAFLCGGRAGRFSSWPGDAQDAWLRRWEQSRIAPMRTIFQAFRRLILSTWYATPSVLSEIGFRGPLHNRAPAVPWEGPLPGEPRDSEPILRVPVLDPVATEATIVEEHSEAWRTARRALPGIVQGHHHSSDSRIHADVCVVGTGAGGAVAATSLAERGFDVVMLEEGGYWAAADFTEEEGLMVPRLYADAGGRATDDLSLAILQGRCVGGGTTVNWMIMLRPPEWVLDEWADEHGTEGMRAADLAPVFDRVERDVHARMVPDDAHGPSNRIILDGARQLGWHARSAMVNARDCVRAGFCGIGCRYGAKQGTLATYVPRALVAGARLYSDASVQRVEVVERGGPTPLKRVHATVLDRETGLRRGSLTVDAPIVILAAGAVGTPTILQRSGFGGGGVGKYLRVHPTTAVIGRYDREIYGSAGIPQSALCDEFMRGDGRAYGFWIECPSLLPAIASVAVPGFGADHRAVMRDFTRLGSLIVLTRDGADRARSSGSVTLDRRGRTHISYRLAAADRRTVLSGITATARMHFAAGAEALTLHSPSLRLRGEGDLPVIAERPAGPNQLGLFTAHMNGTCRIGRDPATSGCTPDGERHGVRGLYVMDGSILPTAPGVNPQNTIMGLATVLSGRIVDRP